jgi:uncharacterized membrane protein
MRGHSVPIIIFIFAIVIGIVIIHRMIQRQKNSKTMYHKGHWMGIGIAVGMPLGLILGICMENTAVGIALGPIMGVAIGTVTGFTLRARFQDNTRAMTKKEKHIQKQLTVAGTILLIFGMLILIRKLFL